VHEWGWEWERTFEAAAVYECQKKSNKTFEMPW
jgi:hypothetical protein